MALLQSFKELIVWQKSMTLAKEIYFLTEKLPRKEIYALSSQMRRAAISVPSNIAEGSRRSSRKDYAQFLRIAHGSLSELETQCLLVKDIYKDINFLSTFNLITEIQKMLSLLIKKISPHL